MHSQLGFRREHAPKWIHVIENINIHDTCKAYVTMPASDRDEPPLFVLSTKHTSCSPGQRRPRFI